MAAILDLYLEKIIDVDVIKKISEVIVKEAFPQNPPIVEAHSLCEMAPHFLVSLLLFLHDISMNHSNMNASQSSNASVDH